MLMRERKNHPGNGGKVRTGIQYVKGMSVKEAVKHGFDSIEIYDSDFDEADDIIRQGGTVAGIVVSLYNLINNSCSKKNKINNGNSEEIGTNDDKQILLMNADEQLKKALDKAVSYKAGYVVIETKNVQSASILELLINECADSIKQAGIPIYIENGFSVKNQRYYHNEYSEASVLRRLAAALNAICGSELFGICINVGHTNLLGINVCDMIMECGRMLGLMHMNDNNGITNQYQMPYTFTTGRGILSTDWARLIGRLFRLQFNGMVVFDTKGTFSRAPQGLHGVMLELLHSIANEWENSCFRTAEFLSEPGKQIILFGAGKMAQSYMEAWGKKYPPAFMVDNNRDIWGEVRFGIPVKSPDEILNIPAEKRNVWICNMYYDAIGRQLDDMGVEYRCYWDQYYL